MTKKRKIAVVGGDQRQARLARLLHEDGHDVYAFALDKAILCEEITRTAPMTKLSEKYDCIILPVPVKSDELHLNTPLSEYKYKTSELFKLFCTGQTVVGGKIDNELFRISGKSGIRLYDYLEREDFTVKNSVLTAEGAIELAMKARDTVICGSRCLVIGYGHIGKLLAHYLKGLGADVSVSARKSGDFAWIKAYNFTPYKTNEIKQYISQFDIIFNTVPALVLNEETLSSVKPDAFICDLASKPGGVDFTAASSLGLNTLHALSLPGKVAPVSAAIVLRDTIYNILDEWEK